MTEHFQGPGYGITATNGSSQVPLSTVGLASILSERGWQARFDGEGDLIWDSPLGPCFFQVYGDRHDTLSVQAQLPALVPADPEAQV